MNLIFLSHKHGVSKTVSLKSHRFWLGAAAGFAVPVLLGVLGAWLYFSSDEQVHQRQIQAAWEATVREQEQAYTDLERRAEGELKALSTRIAELQARLVRLDALGERLTEAADLPEGEFDFSQRSPVGGPNSEDLGDAYQPPTFLKALTELTDDIQRQETQMQILGDLLANRHIQDQVYLAGRPIKSGWLSSHFGRRNDPFTGRLAWHNGVDFAGKEGDPIISVGSGVVTWAGDRYGYGYMVEINHGSGYVTRYAHAKAVMVEVGDLVKKGQEIALMGSTGRSTGPHVHFEVHRNGKPVDPARYVRRANR